MLRQTLPKIHIHLFLEIHTLFRATISILQTSRYSLFPAAVVCAFFLSQLPDFMRCSFYMVSFSDTCQLANLPLYNLPSQRSHIFSLKPFLLYRLIVKFIPLLLSNLCKSFLPELAKVSHLHFIFFML